MINDRKTAVTRAWWRKFLGYWLCSQIAADLQDSWKACFRLAQTPKAIALRDARWWRNSRMGLNRVLPHRLFRPPGSSVLTSTSRTARWGPVCRVV